MSAQMVNLCQKNLKFERLEVNVDLALEMFKNNKYKAEQIPHIASQLSDSKHADIFMILTQLSFIHRAGVAKLV
jgi:threonyl-tRNA synthetase